MAFFCLIFAATNLLSQSHQTPSAVPGRSWTSTSAAFLPLLGKSHFVLCTNRKAEPRLSPRAAQRGRGVGGKRGRTEGARAPLRIYVDTAHLPSHLSQSGFFFFALLTGIMKGHKPTYLLCSCQSNFFPFSLLSRKKDHIYLCGHCSKQCFFTVAAGKIPRGTSNPPVPDHQRSRSEGTAVSQGPVISSAPAGLRAAADTRPELHASHVPGT